MDILANSVGGVQQRKGIENSKLGNEPAENYSNTVTSSMIYVTMRWKVCLINVMRRAGDC